MECITSSSFSIHWNGEKTSSFSSSRGLWKWDPFSPYIFVIYMECLSHMISYVVDSMQWVHIKDGRSGPEIAHLLFADDQLFFAEANVGQMECIFGVMEKFCQVSSQKINALKTNVFFSMNVATNIRDSFISRSGFSPASGLGKYLGALPFHGKAKRSNFKGVIQRMNSKLAGWKSFCLSMAGRVTLAKSVRGSMVSYATLHSRIPIVTCKDMGKILRDFI